MEKRTFWQKLNFKYRISIINEETLAEHRSLRLSKFIIFLLICFMLVLSFAVFALVIWFTPLKNYLPGYNENIRQDLLVESIRVDSLMNQLDLQSQYLSVIRDVVAGDVTTDSIQSLDSLALAQKEQLLEIKSQVTEDFMAQYEAKEKEYLSIFDPQQITPNITFFKPTDGEILTNYNADLKQYGISIQTVKNQNVTTVLAGTLVYAYYDIDSEWVLIIQHENDYMSIYKNVSRVFKKVGENMRWGESFGLVSDTKPLYFELWQKGQSVNPTDMITF